MKLSINTPLIDLNANEIANLSSAMSRKLAAAAANHAGKTDLTKATVEDLLNYFPMRYEDRSNMMPIDELYEGLESSVELYVRVSGSFRVGKNRSKKAAPLYIFEITGSDAERTLKPVVVWWFVSGKSANHFVRYWTERFTRGTRFVAYGKWEWDTRRNTFALKLNKPDELEILPGEKDLDNFGLLKEAASDSENFEEAITKVRSLGEKGEEESIESDIETPELAMVHVGRCVPIYRKLGPFQTKRLREIFYSVLEKLDKRTIRETLPEGICERQTLISRADALTEIHFPPDNSSLIEYAAFRSKAQRRLIFEEFFLVSFALQYRRGERIEEPKGTKISITKAVQKRIKKLLPFKLTNAQEGVIESVFEDMASDSPMNRLVQGDVGSGKTIIAFLAMFAAMENGYQAALMAPTEILADQHARNARILFESTPYSAGLLIGSLKAAEKRKVQSDIKEGNIDAIIGTHALIQDAVEFNKLGLAVIDEQHRFGVLQRAQLKESGYNPDILVMTATPIPRSLAMTVYGDLDVSVIDELPPGRTPVKTVAVGEDQRKGVYKGIKREIDLGRQAYIVYPLIQESEKMDLKAATKMFEELRDRIFPKLRIGLLHGKMKSDEKDQVMTKFVGGEIDVLVSTTVIEVGVDVPNASLMIIEHAERFGLSQLHQLRGRVGRGAERSFCVLLTGDKKTAVAKERLGIMEKTSDGFVIAEKDLEIRGQGDILGTRQSGIQTFKIGNIVRDLEILESAKVEAERFVSDKSSEKTEGLIEMIRSDPRFQLAGIG